MHKDTVILISGNNIAKRIFDVEKIKTIVFLKSSNIFRRQIYKLSNKIGKVYRKILSDEVFNIQEKNIIIFDSLVNKPFLELLNNLYPNKRLIFFYWNPVMYSLDPKFINKKIECWTYSQMDAVRYGIKFNTTFHSEKLFKNLQYPNEGDIYFVGKNKKRKRHLEHLERFYTESGYKVNFHITKTSKFDIFNLNARESLSYTKVIESSSKYDYLLDFYVYNDSGISLRPLEALILRKNLITNSISIKNEKIYQADIIHPIYKDKLTFKIINEDIRTELIEYYCVEQWLKRFEIY